MTILCKFLLCTLYKYILHEQETHFHVCILMYTHPYKDIFRDYIALLLLILQFFFSVLRVRNILFSSRNETTFLVL